MRKANAERGVEFELALIAARGDEKSIESVRETYSKGQ